MKCVTCNNNSKIELTNGAEIYPHRQDLYHLHFYICRICNNYVGCHSNHEDIKQHIAPLGDIVSKDIKNYRIALHNMIDPLWREQGHSRRHIYNIISTHYGKTYHTANINTVEDYQKIKNIVNTILIPKIKNK